ncbi:Pre-rRNA-processing protein RIX1 [Trichoderma simmonsii]|uniref:Pre-rRNA-processing protein RIX1 n=1 Tax=Trichoderma simmonsii TaxID=1491479 RepID=A0A8G0L9U4_9HYPO|nr:Pre-rRNA-processing protein RIX1 [Trichoderma simmonsii]
MSSSASTDLRVLTRKLTSIPPAQLPHSLPSLIRHVLRCRDALSAPQDPKAKGDASQTTMLVHKLKTSITTHLNGRSREGRFAAIGLIKAAVDVGGWETLRGSEAWVRGLLSIVQKADPAASKELAVVTLTKIFMLVHPYQTLVREVATPFLPTFGTACLQLIKTKSESTPLNLIETICSSFSTLIPLYPPTFRPFSAQVRAAVGVYLAPTCSDEISVPESLQRAARRLVASLHFVAAKSGGSDEWAKLVDGILQEFHATADQVLRAVDESWEATSGRSRTKVDVDGEPHGQGSSAEHLPAWSGLEAGTDRLIGLFQFLADLLSYPTKAAVAIPLSGLVDTISRVCLIARLSKSQTWEQAVETNPAIGREEKEELWSLMPDIHVAAMKLVIALFQRLQRHMLPLVPEILDHLIRIFKSGISIPSVRIAGYTTLNTILQLAGPTLSKTAVEMLDPLVGACCRDLQQDAGFLKPAEKPAATTTGKGPKNGAVAVNTDLFLQPQAAAAATEAPTLEADHRDRANELLTIILAQLPQSHLKPALRGHLDKTAILTRNRDAMLASVLNPYRDQHGRMYPSILPHLSQLFPHDQGLEILRSNLRTSAVAGSGSEMFASLSEVAELQQIEEENEEVDEEQHDEEMQDQDEKNQSLEKAAALSDAKVDLPIQSTASVTVPNPFEPRASNIERAVSPPKRKHEGSEAPLNPKRQELEKKEPAAASAPVVQAEGGEEESDSDSDGSVHLNMELEEDEEDENDDE